MTSLSVEPCQDLCAWRPDDVQLAGAPRRFSCRGCGSQWDRTERWTPYDRDGTISPEVSAERR